MNQLIHRVTQISNEVHSVVLFVSLYCLKVNFSCLYVEGLSVEVSKNRLNDVEVVEVLEKIILGWVPLLINGLLRCYWINSSKTLT